MAKDLVVLVDGDTTVDWAVNRAQEGVLTSEERLTAACSAHWLWGGAFLLTHLVKQAVGDKARVLGITHKEEYPGIGDDRVHHSFNTLDKLPLDDKSRKPEDKARWRVSAFTGFYGRQDIKPYPSEWDNDCSPYLVVVNDSALGYSRAQGPWTRLNKWIFGEGIQRDETPWLLVNLRLRKDPLSDTLWDSAYRQLHDAVNSPSMARRLITLTTADSLRDIGAEISRGLSWEKSALDTVREIYRNPALSRIRECPRLIVSFGPSGVLLIDTYNDPPYELVFDRQHTEGSWDRDHSDGRMFGYSQVLTAAVASQIVSAEHSPAMAACDSAFKFHDHLRKGIGHGLTCMHRIFNQGFKEPDDTPSAITVEDACMEKRMESPPQIGVAAVQDPQKKDTKNWSILEEEYSQEDALTTATSVVHRGIEWLRNVPVGKFEDYISVDRRELEALRAIQNLIAAYLDDKHKIKPRSIAVFGAPGDGKSYAVTQVAKSLGLEETLTFNLSQFESSRDLIAALHQVRDSCLAGHVPLVFWDEFDATLGTDLGWLRFFLAPMQDGKFQEDQITHHVGRCIFVFAGGISRNYKEFLGNATKFPNAKVKDFASRLRGYVNILGVNPTRGSTVDLRVLVRRAILLNEFIRRAGIREEKDGSLDVDNEVIKSFLKVSSYQNGTRSMEAIVDMSRLHKGGRFSRSSFPPSTQLELHVSPSDFLQFSSSDDGAPDWQAEVENLHREFSDFVKRLSRRI